MNDNITSIVLMSLLSVDDLAKILGVGPKTLYARLYKSPASLPQRFSLPGSRLVRWHPEVVRRWMDGIAGLTSAPSPPHHEKEKRPGPGRPKKSEKIERERRGGV